MHSLGGAEKDKKSLRPTEFWSNMYSIKINNMDKSIWICRVNIF